MGEIPEGAISAAAKAIHRDACPTDEDHDVTGIDRRRAVAALEAAAPLLAEAVAAKILDHMEEYIADPDTTRLTRVSEVGNRAARRHFRTAAQIASLAFSTREDQLRMAAEAIERGDVIVCDIPEVPDA